MGSAAATAALRNELATDPRGQTDEHLDMATQAAYMTTHYKGDTASQNDNYLIVRYAYAIE